MKLLIEFNNYAPCEDAHRIKPALSLRKYANKNAPAMVGAFVTHHRKIHVWV
jgi:hypothetical protein